MMNETIWKAILVSMFMVAMAACSPSDPQTSQAGDLDHAETGDIDDTQDGDLAEIDSDATQDSASDGDLDSDFEVERDRDGSENGDFDADDWICLPIESTIPTACVSGQCADGHYCLKRDDTDAGICLPDCTPGVNCPCGLCGAGCPPGQNCPCDDENHICTWETNEHAPSCKRRCDGMFWYEKPQCRNREICLFDHVPERTSSKPYSWKVGRCVFYQAETDCPEGFFKGGTDIFYDACFPRSDTSICAEDCRPGYACENSICVPQCPERCYDGYCVYATAPGCLELECSEKYGGCDQQRLCCGKLRCCEPSPGENWGTCRPVDECESGSFADPSDWY